MIFDITIDFDSNIHYSCLIELQTELFTELNSQIGRIDGIGTTNS